MQAPRYFVRAFLLIWKNIYLRRLVRRMGDRLSLPDMGSTIIRKMTRSDNILVAGHRGLAGNAIVRNLLSKGYQNLILCGREELDLAS